MKTPLAELDGDEMTGDLARLWEGDAPACTVDTEAFIRAIRARTESI